MPIVGNKESFAIEWSSAWEDNNCTSLHFCFWIHGQIVGDFEDEVYLHVARTYLECFVSKAGEREITNSAGGSKEELFAKVYESVMYTAPSSSAEEGCPPSNDKENKIPCDRIDSIREAFHLDDVGQTCFYDKVNIVLVADKDAGKQRLIWRDLKSMELNEAVFGLGHVENVSQEFLAATN